MVAQFPWLAWRLLDLIACKQAPTGPAVKRQLLDLGLISLRYRIATYSSRVFVFTVSSLPMPLLSINALRKSYARPDGSGQTAVVDVPEFTLEAGEQLALRGESGSGKTTFLHLIAGILAADAGSITIDGRDMAKLSESRRDRLRSETI